MTQCERLLRELVARPSVNPAFVAAGDPHGGEHALAEFVAQTARRAGLEVEFQPVLPKRANVLTRLTPAGPVRQRLLLAPHLDTVGAPELTAELFTPRRLGRRLYGRGACDTKGSVAAMLLALSRLAASRRRPTHTEIVFAGLVDEESGQAGSRALAAQGPRADLAIVGEPTGLQVVTTHKGVMWLELATRGRAAHGARPELGRNAVEAMAKVVLCLAGDYAHQLRRRRPHPFLGRPTINIGSIQGGCEPNIVPAACVLSLDRRTLPGERPREVQREIATFLRRKQCRVTLRPLHGGERLPLATNPRSTWVQQLLRCVGQRQPAGVDFFTDAGVLAAAGTPSVVFGPGDIAQAHRPDEWIDLDALERGWQLLAGFLATLP